MMCLSLWPRRQYGAILNALRTLLAYRSGPGGGATHLDRPISRRFRVRYHITLTIGNSREIILREVVYATWPQWS